MRLRKRDGNQVSAGITHRSGYTTDAAYFFASTWPEMGSFAYAGMQTTTITRRSPYFLAGQAVTVWQVAEGVSNNLLHLHFTQSAITWAATAS